jgi:hypothetical protein
MPMCKLVKELPVVSSLESVRFQSTTIKNKEEGEISILLLSSLAWKSGY